jgi:hypothetical protein
VVIWLECGVLAVAVLVIQLQLRRLNRDTAELFFRSVERVDKLRDKVDHLSERCNSLQAQINVANRAAEHARGVRQ